MYLQYSMCTAMRLILIHKSDGKKSVTIINKLERIYIEGTDNNNKKIVKFLGATVRRNDGLTTNTKKREAKALPRHFLSFFLVKKAKINSGFFLYGTNT